MEKTDGRGTGTAGRGRQLRRLPTIIRRTTVRLLVPAADGRPDRAAQRRRHLLQTGSRRGRRHAPKTAPVPTVSAGHGPRDAGTERPSGLVGGEQFAEHALQLLLEPIGRGTVAEVAQSGRAARSGIARHRGQTVALRRRGHHPRLRTLPATHRRSDIYKYCDIKCTIAGPVYLFCAFKCCVGNKDV